MRPFEYEIGPIPISFDSRLNRPDFRCAAKIKTFARPARFQYQ
jgi:hypothetical protein